MKVLILAGGLGTRLSEESDVRPKPMVEIGERPILWHIMKTYSHYGFDDFIVLTGYKSHIIKDYFINYYSRYSDITVDLAKNSVEIHKTRTEPWKVTMLYTGQDTKTAGRIARAKEYVKDETFMLTYGDGVGDIDINELVDSHKKSGKAATVTAVKRAGRFGSLAIQDDNSVSSFVEKPEDSDYWVNGGFFVLEPEIFDYIEDNNVMFEHDPLSTLASEGKLNSYKHTGFWRPMDTLKDKIELNQIWQEGKAPWKVWE